MIVITMNNQLKVNLINLTALKKIIKIVHQLEWMETLDHLILSKKMLLLITMVHLRKSLSLILSTLMIS
jgi:hypothetical protein